MSDPQFQPNPQALLDPPQNSSTAIGGRFVIRLILAVLLTLAGIQYSFQHGRLLRRPVTDDAVYMCDSLVRLHAFYETGIWGLAHSLMSDPPHAPFSTLLGMVSFMLFGRHDWAPYAGNVVIVLGLLTAVDWLVGDVKAWQRGLIYALVLCTRWPWAAVTEFRPDIACGLALAVAVIYCLRKPLIGSSLGHRLGLGAWFGLVLFTKPAMFPVNLPILGACLLTALSLDFLLRQRRPTARQIAAAIVVPVAMAVVVILPYAAFAWKPTWDYFYSNIFGSRKELWWFRGTRLQYLRYYLDQPGGCFIVSPAQIYLLLALAVIGVLLVLRGKNRDHRFRAIGLAVVGLIIFAIPTAARDKNHWFGAGFQTLLVLGAVMMLRRVIALRKSQATFALIIACMAGVCMFTQPVHRGNPWEASAIDSNRLLNQIYSRIQTDGQLGDCVFVPVTAVSVTWSTLNYMSLSDDSLRYFTHLDFEKWDDRQLVLSELDQADWVVAEDPGNDEASPDLRIPNTGLQLYLDCIHQSGEFVEVAEFPAWTNRKYHLFSRKTPAFSGFIDASATGLLPPVGPYPSLRLPMTRSAVGAMTRLPLPPGDVRRVLILSFVCYAGDQKITIDLDGKQIASGAFDKGDACMNMRLPLNLPREVPHELEIHYAQWDPKGLAPPILFKKIQILNRDESSGSSAK